MRMVFCLLVLCGWQHASAQELGQKVIEFSRSKEWLHALHYQSGISRYKSSVDNPLFFLSKEGKYNPLDELKTSLNFFTTNLKSSEPGKCILPFRYRILLDAGLIKPDPRPCSKLEYFKKELGTDGASMVFVGQYADNPASIMGHSIIAFHNNSRHVEGSPLIFLDYAMNFAAAVPPKTNIVKYIVFGIFGGFQGRYSLLEFGDVFEKYNNMEGRDIFYYRLQFSRLDCEKLLEHIWELISRASHDYFFFDENCAYQLLAALQAVRPDTDLLSDLPAYVSPIEIVKTLVDKKLVSRIDYEPSIFERIVNRLKVLSPSDHQSYFDVLSYRTKVNRIESPLLAEALIDTLSFAKHEAHGKLSPIQVKLQNRLLVKRSTMGLGQKNYVQTKTPPHLSHPDKRLSLGTGASNSGNFFKIHFRPAVHQRLSRPQGYQRNSSLSFLTSDLRYYPEEKRFEFHELKLLEGSKLRGYPVLPRFSWHTELGIINDQPNCNFCPTPRGLFDFGKSKSFFFEKLDVYGMLRTLYHDQIEAKVFGLALGLSMGMFYTPSTNFRAYINASRTRNMDGFFLDELESGCGIDGPNESDVRLIAQLQRLNDLLTKREFSIAAGYSF